MALASIVVIPARDEEDQIPGCMSALGAQTVPREEFEVIVVVDACSDRTAEVARPRSERAVATALAARRARDGAGRGPASRHGSRRRASAGPGERGRARGVYRRGLPPRSGLARASTRARSRGRACGRGTDRARPRGVRTAPARGVATARARRRGSSRARPSTAIQPPPTIISPAPRSGSPPASTGRSAVSSRWRRSRTRRLRSGWLGPAFRSSTPTTSACAPPPAPTAARRVGCRSTSRCRLGRRGAATRPARTRPSCYAAKSDDVGGGGDPDQGVRRHARRRSDRHRGSAARRRRWSTKCWSSTPIRPMEPPKSGARPAPR